MPNHVTTEVHGPAAIVAAITRTHTEAERLAHEWAEDDREKRFAERGEAHRFRRRPFDMEKVFIDFEMLIPQPENIEVGACSGQHDEGVVCWYSWSIENWGTKWNGYALEIVDIGDSDRAILRFDTAWAHPFPIIEALSKKFADADLEVSYADEDLGFNCNQYVIRNGEITQKTEFEGGSEEALDFAARLKYGLSYAELRAEWDDED